MKNRLVHLHSRTDDDLLRTSQAMWYGKGLRFACRECGACCTGEPGFVWVTRAEAGLLAAFLDASDENFARTRLRRVGNRTSLRERSNGDCVLLRKGRCTAYEARPFQCRTWPFWAESLQSEERWRQLREICPGIGQGALYSADQVETLSGRQRPKPKWLRAFAELLRLYRDAERWSARQGRSCRGCGECCDFERCGHELYASMIEAAWMLYAARPSQALRRGSCPFHVRGKCTNRAGRTLGCRTYFCRGVNVPEAVGFHEELLSRLKASASALRLPWAYDRIDRMLARTMDHDELRNSLFCTFSS